jgi:hypothetical protein
LQASDKPLPSTAQGVAHDAESEMRHANIDVCSADMAAVLLAPMA